MNIAVFIKRTTFHAGFGGLETQNKTLCEGLVVRGHKVTVFSPKLELDKDTEKLNGVSYIYVDCSFRSLAGFDRLDKNNWTNRSVAELEKIHKIKPVELILAQSSAGLGVIRKKEKLNIPIVSIAHGSTLGELDTTLRSLKTFKDWMMLIPKLAYFVLNYLGRQREFVLHSDRIVTVSEYVKKSLVDETFVDEGKLDVIYNGVDPEAFTIRNKRTTSIQIFYVGLIHWSKGLKHLVEAFEELNMGNVRLTIAGDGEHLGALRDMVQKKGLDNIVKVLGRVPHEDVASLMLDSDIFVIPSKRVEGFPMTIPEAMFAGLPVIGTSMGGIPEGIEEGKTGFVVKSGDSKILAKALRELVLDSALREKMSEAALDKARREFTLDVMLNKYEEVLRKACL
jgi:glycosyltransferase involved in cell wall biosynthesis